jgi:hypothetical protein
MSFEAVLGNKEFELVVFGMSPTHYRGSIGDVFYLIPFKTIPIPGFPIDVAAVNLLLFVLGIYLIITCDIPVFYVKYCRKRENII